MTSVALLALLPLGCAADAFDPEEAGNQEQVGQVAEAIVAEALPVELVQFPVEIKNVNSGKCLDIESYGTQNGANAQQFTCTAGANQTFYITLSNSATPAYQIRAGHTGNKNLDIAGSSLANNANVDIADVVNSGQLFKFAKQSDGSYQIASTNSGRCLDVTDLSTANNANVQQYGCGSGLNQRWIIRPRGVALSLSAKHSDRCVDVASGSTANNANVQQYDCLDGDNQKWSIGSIDVVSGVTYFSFVAKHSGKCLDVAGNSTANNANVQQYDCNGGDNQKWQLTENSDGYVTLQNKLSGKCLDVAGLDTANNANIQQFTCNGGDNQRFFWSIVENRHVQVVQIAKSNGTSRQTQTDAAVSAHVARANGVYGKYGLRLTYTSAQDKSNVNSDALFALGNDNVVRTCPDGTTGTPDECADRYAQTNWPNKVVLFSRPGNGYSGGNASYIVIGAMGSDANLVCTDVPDTQWLAHEFGHYVGIGHTFSGDGDLLSDTRPDPSDDPCLAPHSATGVASNGATVDTNNVLSYYYNANVTITRMQAGLARAGAYSRGWL